MKNIAKIKINIQFFETKYLMKKDDLFFVKDTDISVEEEDPN